MERGTVSAVLDGDLLAQLKRIAAEEERSISFVVGAAVKQYLGARAEAAQPFRDGAAKHYRQVHIEDAIVAAKKKAAKHK